MTFDEFKQEVQDHIKDFLPVSYQDTQVELKDVIKNNDTHLTGLTIHSGEECISPTLYLENFYQAVESGEHSLNGVMMRIAETYDEAMQNDITKDAHELVNNITDYEATKEKIVPRVVNKESNEERLKDMPHKDMGDLAITYHVNLGKDDDGNMSVAISNQMMEKYGVTVDELHDQACANMENVSPTQIKSMADTLMEIMVPDFAEMTDEEKEQTKYEMGLDGAGEDAMFVISNSDKTFGAAALLDSDAMDKIEEQIGEFYILPSSVHECILVPKKEDMDLETLENMVQEVNATQVSKEEKLSDHVYAYDSETKEIYRADQEAEHNLAKEEAKKETLREKTETKAEKTEITTEKKERPSLKAKLSEKKKEVKEMSKESKTQELSKEINKKTGRD
ncbi:MAG: hypothetical protein IK121_08895 [Lachnospiraceae bacterium]|nr:hypothetical protein [Lachnospiraceae bacterium]